MTGMISDAQLVEQYLRLKGHIAARKEAHAEELKPYQDGMDTIENVFLARLNERGAENSKTDSGTAYKSTLMTPKVVARDVFLKFCVDNWSTVGSDMLQVGATKDAVKQFIENSPNPPPGLEVSFFTRVNIRKS